MEITTLNPLITFLQLEWVKMWFEVMCGLAIYGLYKLIFSDGDDVLDVETSDSSALFAVADRLAKLYDGAKVYVGLRIPDADTSSPQHIDLVLLNKGEAVVIAVKNFSGFLSVKPDGSWVTESITKHRTDQHPNPLAETMRQASILESYLEQRGAALPQGYVSCKVILSNPKVCTIQSSSFPSEIITYDQWVQMKPEPKSMFSGWMKSAFRTGKKENQESIHQKLEFILSTAPMWDRWITEYGKVSTVSASFTMNDIYFRLLYWRRSRLIGKLIIISMDPSGPFMLELKGNKYVLGEFLEFKGKQEDVQALRHIKRSKINRLVVQKTSMLGFAPSRLQVLYSRRDYRSEGGASASEWKEVNVRSSTEAVFQLDNSSKIRKFKLSSICSMSLSA